MSLKRSKAAVHFAQCSLFVLSSFGMFKSIAFVALVAASAFAAPTIELSARSGVPNMYNIHPSVDSTKCVGIDGGVYADGSLVDM